MKYSPKQTLVLSVLATLAFINAEERLISDEFKTPKFSANDIVGWNSKNIKKCDSTNVQEYSGNNIFGIFAMETPNLQKIYANLPPHWSLSVRVDVLLYRSVDNEKVNMVLDGKTYTTYTKGKADGFDICDTSYWYNDELFFFQKNITHTDPQLNLQLISNFDQDNDDEGFGIRNLSVRIDTCHPSCAACSGPNQNQCTQCPSNQALKLGTCLCPGMTIAHNNQCLNDCPYGFQRSSDNIYCIESKCNPLKCSKCDDKTKNCISCSDGFFLFQNSCVSSCPSFAPQSGKVCQDPALSTPNGKYLMYGLTSNNFGEAEIAGLGLELSGFNQVTFSNCGGVQLLGGPFIGGKSSSIKRMFKDILPHYQIRFGFVYYQIDSWDDEGFKIYTDSNLIDEIKQHSKNGKQNLCGSTSWKDTVYNYTKTIAHNSTSFEIKMDATFDEDTFNESVGIRDIFFIVDECSPGCASCNDKECLICLDGFNKTGGKCLNSCADHEYSSNKQCLPCDASCKSCKDSSTSCTSCQSGTYLYQNQCLANCPQNFFNNSKLSICSQCSQGDCPKCVPPGYSSQCKDCSGFKIISNKCPL